MKKKQILYIISRLLEIRLVVDKSNVNKENIIEEITELQELAIYLGNYFEKLKIKDNLYVSIIENYCESIYQISINLDNKILCNKFLKEIQEQLIFIYKKIKLEFAEDNKEILFLPYKASMWDSLESIWKAACEKKQYDVYVVPIPYYDKNKDGSIGKMHYEGNQYPNYVTITSYNEYHLEEHKPDVVYIHNPYDQYNLVTTIDPRFYSTEIKKYTKKLVYIPYFVTVNDNVMSDFCVLPGTIYSDKVIVESEKVKKQYIQEMFKILGKNKYENIVGDINKKIIALGSPKYDKVLNINKQDIVIPKEWQKIINKESNNRKIVLYNISLTNIVNYKEEMILEIKETLKIFKELKDDILLLWRPHPLIISTLKSRIPSLYQSYISIVEQYKRESYGIYDETSDLYRAIAISDAYYGDAGSLLALYQKTGKPIMLHKMEVAEQHYDKE